MAARYEYKVVPAPRTAAKVRGVKGEEARFAFTIEGAINASAAEGWEYVRSETMPCESRGWFSRSTRDQTVLIFRRERIESAGEMPALGTLRLSPEPRLAADRVASRPAGVPTLRAARDGEPG